MTVADLDIADELDPNPLDPPLGDVPDPPRSSSSVPLGTKRGICSVCGDDAYSRHATKCETHRTLRPDARPRPRSSSTRAPSSPRPSSIERELRINLEFVASIWSIKDPECAGVLTEQAETIAKFWGGRARQSARVNKVLTGVVSSGGWLGAIGVHAPLAMAVYAHHVAPSIAARALEPDEGDTWAPGPVGVPTEHAGEFIDGQWVPYTPAHVPADGYADAAG